MKVKCEYCGNYISDTDEKCPNCQAINEHLKRVGNEVPTTIEELQTWYKEHNLPPEETTRFFIGKDIKEARAFGIYKEEKTGNFIVYKNKDNGSRAVRYEGKDETYAINELYMKLKEEILHQKDLNVERRMNTINENKTYPTPPPASTRFKKGTTTSPLKILLVFLLALLPGVIFPGMLAIISELDNKNSGYYMYQNEPYYLYQSCAISSQKDCEWYYYDSKKEEWSQADNVKITKTKYIGKEWDNTNNIQIAKSYEEEDWFRELHPPVPDKGYYSYNDKTYYYLNQWYIYENNMWFKSSAPNHDVELYPDNYYDKENSNSDTYNFNDTSYYYNYYNSNSYNYNNDYSYDNNYSSSWDNDYSSSWDNDSSWSSSDSWDSGSTDWDSDW